MSRVRVSSRASVAVAVSLLAAAPVAVGDQLDGPAGSERPLVHSTTDGVLDTPLEAHRALEGRRSGAPDDQHGTLEGHLPPSRGNVEVVGKLDLGGVPGGIADVSALAGYAYLGNYSPECAGRSAASAGGGVHVVDIGRPEQPRKVAFIPSPPNNYVSEGVHVLRVNTPAFRGDLLLHNNEACDSSRPHVGGISIWDVTDPTTPRPLAQGAGDTAPALPASIPSPTHRVHSVQGWTTGGRAYAALVDNDETRDIDILDITDPRNPVLVSERGFEDFPQAQAPLANGDSVFHHDMQVAQIGGHWFLQASYWDAGFITLNVDDPANPVFVDDSDYRFPDPLTGLEVPEGNAHQSYWSADHRFVLGADEDFSPFRMLFRIETGRNAGAYGGGEFGWTVPLDTKFPGGFRGVTIWGGSGCETEDLNGNGRPDREDVPPASDFSVPAGRAKVVVFSRGVCVFSKKVESGQVKGYDAVLIGNHHVGARRGLVPDAFVCGSIGHTFTPTVSGLCTGHRAMHLLFDDDPNYAGPESYESGGDMPPIGTRGQEISASVAYDGWGYVHLLDADTLEEIDAYAVDEAVDSRFAEGFGDLTVHETKTDPTEDLAYFSWYNAGFRVARFGRDGIEEVGHFIDEGGSDIWGIFPITSESGQRLILASDRDVGLYVLRYTGPGAAVPPACSDVKVSAPFGGAVTIPLLCTDPNGNRLTRTIVSTPAHGTLGPIDQGAGTVRYTPAPGFSGPDQFRFKANDGGADSNLASVGITVLPQGPLAGRCANPLLGTAADELINGSPFGDRVLAGSGNDNVNGLQGDDCLFGQLGRDRLEGADGNDVLDGDEGADILDGGIGRDRLYGGDGNDKLEGASGPDTLRGNAGRDKLSGGAGNDVLYGGAGNDTISGGQGKNRLSGGAGNDSLNSTNGKRDVVNCGVGRDKVRADRKDSLRGCEIARRF